MSIAAAAGGAGVPRITAAARMITQEKASIVYLSFPSIVQ
jgi:hypothetical protein